MPLAMLGMGYLPFGYFFPSHTFRGSREALAETEQLGECIRRAARLGPLRIPSLTIAADDLVAVEFTRFWTRRFCEITHTSAQAAGPIRLSYAEQDPVVAARRSLLPPLVSL